MIGTRRRLAAWGPKAIVTLVEDHEFEMLRVCDLGQCVPTRGIDWHYLPNVEVDVSDARFKTGWQQAGPIFSGHLARGERVIVHCRGGLGRAGMVAARLLIELGSDSEDTVRTVRAARPGAIETHAQLDYGMQLADGQQH